MHREKSTVMWQVAPFLVGRNRNLTTSCCDCRFVGGARLFSDRNGCQWWSCGYRWSQKSPKSRKKNANKFQESSMFSVPSQQNEDMHKPLISPRLILTKPSCPINFVNVVCKAAKCMVEWTRKKQPWWQGLLLFWNKKHCSTCHIEAANGLLHQTTCFPICAHR